MGEVRERKSRTSAESDRTSSHVRPVAHAEGGRPLDSNTRAVMESRFGHDFSKVQVHEGPKSAMSARTMKTSAFTIGNDIFFGDGKYRNGTQEGQRILAHELTHVVQQSTARSNAGANPESLQISDSSENEAAQVEDALVHNGSVPTISQTGMAVMRIGPTKDSVVAAIKKLIDSKYGGDYKKAFDHYAKNGAVDKNGVKQLVVDAGYGGTFDPTSAIVDGIMKAVDTNSDGKITWEEFSAVVHK
ncbi:MAG: DUF4157 domain-containing protein [Thaumarchaeota archaeon]|nr:DUF4157 domain-containing protein [Nitrososphaerota archaeon]